jgi:hypothetical protein
MSTNRSRLVGACLLVSAALAVVMTVRCGTSASAIVPPSSETVKDLILQNDRPLGLQTVSAISNISIGGFNASSGTWTVQADVQHGGLLSGRQTYLVYRDTEGRWAIRKP